jgi:hypothetical protein
MASFTITPKVDQTQEFLEIANDFSNPLELVREAISNAFDAQATKITLKFTVEKEQGEPVLHIVIEDDGHGMDEAGLQSFFDLGNSLRRGDPQSIGEKGHGTKVYFNSARIEVITTKKGQTYHATMLSPFKKLFNREIPTVDVTEILPARSETGTTVAIVGYNNNRRELFTHERLKDYIQWFTKFGSIETSFDLKDHVGMELHLTGLDRSVSERLDFGHYFPPDSKNMQYLFDEHLVKAPDYYCKRIVKEGHLRHFPEIKYSAVFCLEGNKVKQSYNKMLTRPGYKAPEGAYTVQQRYGVWLCKDFIPIGKKNEWITFKGSEYTKFHAFFNCQNFRLTANRGSVDNTPADIMSDVKDAMIEIYNGIVQGDAWREIEWLEGEAEGYRTSERERTDFEWRIKKANKSNVCEYKGKVLVEPERESGVLALFLILDMLTPELFPFGIVDYDTHSGIDVIAIADKTTPLQHAKLYYVEFKLWLTAQFNHSFENLFSIVCWDTEIKNGDILTDVNTEERKMQIVPDGDPGGYTKYFLDHPKKAHKIQVFVLKDYLREKLGLEFRPRTTLQTPATTNLGASSKSK